MFRTVLYAAIVSAAAVLPQVSNAQAFEGGDNIIGLGVGAGGYYRAYNAYSASTPLITAHFEHALNVKAGPGVIGAGAFFGYKSVSYKSNITGPYYYDYRWNYIQFGARGAYHWNAWHGVENLDTYAGVLIGASIVSYADNSNYPYAGYNTVGSRGSGARHDLFAGARWYFSDGFGVWAEVGYGLANLSAGLGFKF